LYFQCRELIYKATVCSSSVGLALESNCLCHPYAGGTTSCFLNQFPTLVAYPYTQGTTLHWRYKNLLSESIPTLVT